MKKICFIGFNLFSIGGGQKVTLSLCNDLCVNHNVHILNLCEILDRKNYFVDNRVFVHSFNMPASVRARHSLSAIFKIKKFLKDKKIDILFISGTLPIPIVSLVRLFIKIKVVFCDHENILNRDKKSIFFRKLACKISNKIVVLTHSTAKDYPKIFNIDENKIKYIYNYIDDKIYMNTGNYNINSKKIISVGRLSREKGFDLAVEIAKYVFNRHSDWQWHLYGDGPEHADIKNKIKECCLENKFILKGSWSNIHEIYKDYGIYVLTSYREGFGLVLLEAKANRLPIVSFKSPTGPEEIVRNGVDGYLITCYDKEEMAEKICKLIEEPELRQNFSNNANNNLNKFSKAKILNQWNELINNL